MLFDLLKKDIQVGQIPKVETFDLNKNGKLLKDSGFSYTNSASKELIEHHVDDIYKAKEKDEHDNQQGFDGNLCVHYDGIKLLIIFCHDENIIFKQYTHANKGCDLLDDK